MTEELSTGFSFIFDFSWSVDDNHLPSQEYLFKTHTLYTFVYIYLCVHLYERNSIFGFDLLLSSYFAEANERARWFSFVGERHRSHNAFQSIHHLNRWRPSAFNWLHRWSWFIHAVVIEKKHQVYCSTTGSLLYACFPPSLSIHIWLNSERAASKNLLLSLLSKNLYVSVFLPHIYSGLVSFI